MPNSNCYDNPFRNWKKLHKNITHILKASSLIYIYATLRTLGHLNLLREHYTFYARSIEEKKTDNNILHLTHVNVTCIYKETNSFTLNSNNFCSRARSLPGGGNISLYPRDAGCHAAEIRALGRYACLYTRPRLRLEVEEWAGPEVIGECEEMEDDDGTTRSSRRRCPHLRHRGQDKKVM
jgi:hypothetical protein